MQELLLLVLPLLNMMSIRKVLSFPFSSQAPASSLPEDVCPICEACPITTPYMALPCGHLYCYYCLRTRSLSDRNFKCSRCSISIVAIKRHHVEVTLDGAKPSETDSQYSNLMAQPHLHLFSHFLYFLYSKTGSAANTNMATCKLFWMCTCWTWQMIQFSYGVSGIQ